MPPSRPRSSSTPVAPQPVTAAELSAEYGSDATNLFPSLSRARNTPSPTSERPLSNEEIHLLLDRASQPAVNPPPEAPAGRFEDTLERLRTTRRRIREMQARTSTLVDITDNIAPRLDPLSADIGDLPWDWTDPLERALRPDSAPEAVPSDRSRRSVPRRAGASVPSGVSVYDNADDALAAANDYLSSMRADPLRVPTRMELDRMGAGMDALEPEIIEAVVRERFVPTPRAVPAASRARTRGYRPTNVQRLRHAPKPEVVRSTPPSPASTITPEMPIADLPDPGAASRPGTYTFSSALAHPNALERAFASRRDEIRAMRNSPTSPRNSTASGTPAPMTFGNSSLALPVPTARTRRRRGDDDSLTFRGMDVNARINDPDAPRQTGDMRDSMVTELILSVFSQFRNDDPPRGAPTGDAPLVQPLPPFAPRLANTRIPTPASRRSAAAMDLVAAEDRLANARRALVQLEAQAEQEEAERRDRRGVLGVEDVLRGLGEGDAVGAGAIGTARHRERSAALTAGGEGSGPRNERPEDVDTVVTIRQFQEIQDETRQRVRQRLRHLADVRRAADDVYQARRGAALASAVGGYAVGGGRGTRHGHELAQWANDAPEGESIFDATRRALASGSRGSPRPSPGGTFAGGDGVYVTVAVSTDPPLADDGGAAGIAAEGADAEIVESMRRQFESLSGGANDPMPDLDGDAVWHMEVIGPNGQVLEARGEGLAPSEGRAGGGEGMEGSMERLAWAIVQSAEGGPGGEALEGSGQAVPGAHRGVGGGVTSSVMSREASTSSNRAVEGEEKNEHRGSVATRSDVKDGAQLEAQAWSAPAPSARSTRPYISLLDL